MTVRPLKWILSGAFLALLLFGHGFGAEWWSVPPQGQPAQMQSRVDYDPNLADPFFEADDWGYPWWIIEHPDGHFESTRSEDERPVKDPPRVKYTAKCFSTSRGSKHLVSFCDAKLLGGNMIDLLIHESNPADDDALRIQIRNGMVTCQY